MPTGLILLCLAYVLSQFFRSFLAVLAPVLTTDLGATADDLAQASSLWFLIFAAMQIPVGWALDRFGPRRTAWILLLLGGCGGAATFALATTPLHISIAMGLIGIGCSPVLMASFFIFAREYEPARFATLAALTLGIGTTGNLVASYPTALMVDLVGWRNSLWLLAAITAVVALGIALSVRDPESLDGDTDGSLLDILKIKALWLIFPLMLVSYVPAAAIRGLWIGPYLSDIFSLSTSQIGLASLLMGGAMIAGTFAFGPLDRILGTRKWVIAAGNSLGVIAVFALCFFVDSNVYLSIFILAGIGFTGMTFPVIVAHGRSFIPPALVGRGVTLLNLFGIGGVGIMQRVSGRIFESQSALPDATPTATYTTLFAFFGLVLLVGVVLYLFSPDRTD